MAEKNEDKWKRGKYRKRAEKGVVYPQEYFTGKSREYAIEDLQKRLKYDDKVKSEGKKTAKDYRKRYAEENAAAKKRAVGGSAKAAGTAKKSASKKTTRKRVAGK